MTRWFYLGPGRSRLVADTWGDVVSAAGSGVLDETQWVELKKDLPASSKPANLELARDLASLAIDGGTLVIGVADAGGKAGDVVGTDMDGLPTRISQVAAGRIDPPLNVTFDTFEHPDDPGRGVLVVTVPASADAPHMVDGAYWGRSADGKRKLADGEVRRLIGDRRERQVGFDASLRQVPADLDPPTLAGRGRMYVLVEPTAGPADRVTDLLADKSLIEVVREGLKVQPVVYPNLWAATFAVPHGDGILGASFEPDQPEPNGDSYLAGLVRDDGAVELSTWAVRDHTWNGTPRPFMPCTGIMQTVHSAIELASHVAVTHSGYAGQWQIGLLITGIRGVLPSEVIDMGWPSGFRAFPDAEYLQLTRSSTAEMSADAPAVVEQLTRRLVRSVGMGQLLPYTAPSR